MSGRRSNGRADAVDALANKKQLHPDFLRSLGVEARGDDVSISYRAEDGQELFRKLRHPPGHHPRFHNPKGGHVVPYGMDRLDVARRLRRLWIAEGESDTWAFGLRAS